MHDPKAVAHEIYLPFFKNKHGDKINLLTIWHNDPETDGTDDSCGWFLRARHGTPEMKKEIRSAIDLSFDSSFKSDSSGTTYYTGYFAPRSGMPNFSSMGIVLDMFSQATWRYFKHNRKKQKAWMKRNLYDLLHFAENPTDSLNSNIQGTFRIGTGEEWNREDALNEFTSIIYGYILRSEQKWYQHPRWHIHHWSIQFHPWQQLKRRYWDKCEGCGKRGFKNDHAIGFGDSNKIWHGKCFQGHKSVPTPTEAKE